MNHLVNRLSLEQLDLPIPSMAKAVHTHASILISRGIDIVKVSKRLGHANPKITLENLYTFNAY